MDMNASTHFSPIADHRDEVVSFERTSSGRKADANQATKIVATTCGESWYHDAAIAAAEQDAIDARGNPYHY